MSLKENEKELINLIKPFAYSESDVIGCMLLLKDNDSGRNELINYIKNTKVDMSDIIRKTQEIWLNNRVQ